MPFITITYPPKYPLTESEKKWLEERENRICKFCIHCPGYLHTNPCLDWWGDTCVVDTTLEEFRDSAEFEALVAAKLAEGPEDCSECFWGTNGWSADNAEGRLKHARLAVEAEMNI